jgi:hypothetical protein
MQIFLPDCRVTTQFGLLAIAPNDIDIDIEQIE